MNAEALRRTYRIACLSTIVFGVALLAAGIGAVFGGEFPITAIAWCVLLAPLAVASLVIWCIASVKLERQQMRRGGFEVIPKPPAE
jgi:hypothetical protein